MASNVIERTFQNLDDLGVTEYLLPFLLVFTVVFAVLQKSKILGEDKRNFNVAFSVITAFLFVMPHATGRYPPESDPVVILNKAIPEVSLVLVAVIFLMILIGVFGQSSIFLGVAMPTWILIGSVGTIFLIFGGAAGWWDGGVTNKLVDVFGPDTLSIAIMLLVFGLVVQFIASDPKEKKEGFAGIYPDRIFKGGP